MYSFMYYFCADDFRIKLNLELDNLDFKSIKLHKL